MRLWLEVGESVARAGLRKLIFLNSHGGQPQVMEIVARELRVRRRMLCVACSWWHMGLPEGLFDVQEVRHGVHGGDIETSIMLALRPDLVRMERAENFRPVTLDIEPHFERLRYLGGPAIGCRRRTCIRRAWPATRPGQRPRRAKRCSPMSRRAWPSSSRRSRPIRCQAW